MSSVSTCFGAKSFARLAFEQYLRSGRRQGGRIQVKFNPNHDPRNGQFTFGPGGAGGAATAARVAPDAPSANTRPGTARTPYLSRFSPSYPSNHSIHVVQRGQTLSQIAATRKGLRAEDLAELNGIRLDAVIRPGQKLMLPNQRYLDAGKAARENFVRLEFYRQRHGGALPPDLARAPDILDRVNWTRQNSNGYAFSLDPIRRTREAAGELKLNPSNARSRSNQLNAGKPDRRSTDEGGHYIAREFNGPTDEFNHFAQDRNFNRSGYRALENTLKSAKKNGKQVFIRIVPRYEGSSRRPSSLSIIYTIDGRSFQQVFPNQPGVK